MPTAQAPRVVRRRRAATQARAASARRKTRYTRYLKHPIKSLVSLFSSVRTAIVLIAVIAGICIIGIAIIQAPVEITSSPSDYAAWVSQNMVGKYGQTWTNIFQSLGFFTIFSSWYFRTAMVLLAINVAFGGIIKRAPGIWYTFRYPAVRTNDRFYQNALARKEFSTDQNVEGLRRFFRKKHYRVLIKENSETGTTYLYAYKNAWATLSTFVFHTCLIALMLATVITSWQGFGTNSMAARILPGPVFNYLQSIAGFSYTQPLPDGDSGTVYPIGTRHNIDYRADDFVANFDVNSGQPTDFYTDVSLFQDGTLVAHQRVRVNNPLTYQGVTFHQASFIMYTWLAITDAQGHVLFNQKIVLDQHLDNISPNTGDDVPINLAQGILIPNLEQEMNVSASLIGGTWWVTVSGNDANGHPTFCGVAPEGSNFQLLDLSQSDLSCRQVLVPLLEAYQTNDPSILQSAIQALVQQHAVKQIGWNFNVKLVKRGTVLLITKDSGSPLIWPLSVLLILSLCVSFYFPHRRVWVRFRDGQVQFAGLKEHFINVQRDFEALALQILALDKQVPRSAARARPKDEPPAKAAKAPQAKAGAALASDAAEAEEALSDAEAEARTQDTEVSEPADQAEEVIDASAAETESSETKTEVTAGD
jgi:cytochrome c biogenesis protein